MPSDTSLADRALDALGPRVQAFRSAVTTAGEEIRAWASRHQGVRQSHTDVTAAELGPFAAGRIDPGRFATLLVPVEDAPAAAAAVLERAGPVFDDITTSPEVHRASVPPGGDLRNVVKEALDTVGRIFGVSRAVELARTGRWDPDRDAELLAGVPFRRWNRAERRLAPPLVVDVQPEDLLTAGLGEFLDGLVTIVLVVEGPTPPAPLARLVTPGTWVVQTADPADLDAMARSPHPGVALLFDAERPQQARFVHDPDAGATSGARLTIQHLPDHPTVGRGRRAPFWVEELDHLEALAATSAVAAVGGGLGPGAGSGPGNGSRRTGEPRDASSGGDDTTAPPKDPADRLAAWLLAQTELGGLTPDRDGGAAT